MKPKFSIIILVILLASCIKGVNNVPAPVKTPVVKIASAVEPDTIPDGASFKVQLLRDSLATDETLLIYNHTASTRYINTQDAVYFPGYGAVSLASLTSDGMPCAIQKLPYIQQYPIGLDVSVKTSGIYLLKCSYLKGVPQTMSIWLKDAYMKDSLDLRVGNYAFQVLKTDTNTFGSGRFKIIMR